MTDKELQQKITDKAEELVKSYWVIEKEIKGEG